MNACAGNVKAEAIKIVAKWVTLHHSQLKIKRVIWKQKIYWLFTSVCRCIHWHNMANLDSTTLSNW
jgi:hypothetical protein